MSTETPTAAPDQPQDAQETAPREEEAPISATDAWARLLAAVARVPQDDVTRAISAVARASIRAEQTAPQGISHEWAGAVQFLADLQSLLDRLDMDRSRNSSAVLSHLFSRHSPHGGNGAFR